MRTRVLLRLAGAAAAVPHLRRPLNTTTTPITAVSQRQRGMFSATAAALKDIRKGDRGDSRRLTFEERSERRMGKSREQKETKEALIQEAQLMVNEDFPQDLETLYEQTFEKANVSAMKVLNTAKCLELLEVEMSGGHTVMLTKVAQVVKVDSATIEVAPSNNTFATPILQRISRFDTTLQVSKEGLKIKVVIPPMTTARRDKTGAEIASLTTQFRNRIKQLRTNAGKSLQDCGLDEGVLKELSDGLDVTASGFVEEKAAELELLAEEVMTMGIDESDASLQG